METSLNGATHLNRSIADLSTSKHHRLLAVERRQLVLGILTGESPPADLEALAREVATREAERSPVDAKTVKRTAITIHHAHLPALAEADVLAYNPETHQIDPRV